MFLVSVFGVWRSYPFQEAKALGDSSIKDSSRSFLETYPKYLHLQKEFRRVYGSMLARSYFGQDDGGFRHQRRKSDGIYHPIKTFLISSLKTWPCWDRSFSMDFIENNDGHNYFN